MIFDSIIEIGAIRIDENGLEHTFQRFTRPISPLSSKITNITGITNDMLSTAIPLQTGLSEFLAFSQNSTIVAHNAAFDIPWLLTNLMRYNLPYQDINIVCTLNWAKASKEPKCSLGALSKKYGLAHNNAHRALADAIVTKELYAILTQKYPDMKPPKSLSDYTSICENLAKRYTEYVQS